LMSSFFLLSVFNTRLYIFRFISAYKYWVGL
jgi:hypothetical protein